MSIYKNSKPKHNISDLIKKPSHIDKWEWFKILREESEYLSKLSQKDLLDYRKEKEEDAFLDNI